VQKFSRIGVLLALKFAWAPHDFRTRASAEGISEIQCLQPRRRNMRAKLGRLL
jgi:hypothetical protein